MKSFWMRRVLRIFPLYYAVVIVGTIVAVAAGYYVPGVSYWLYMQNYALAFNPDALRWTAHFWSLAIEEQFYFVWPIVALVVSRRKLVPLTAALIGFVVLFRIAVAFKLGGPFWDEETTIKMVYRATPTRADGLLLGALVAVLQREHGHPLAKAWRKLRAPLLVATGVALLGLYAMIGGLNDYDRRMVASATSPSRSSSPARSRSRRTACLRARAQGAHLRALRRAGRSATACTSSTGCRVGRRALPEKGWSGWATAPASASGC